MPEKPLTIATYAAGASLAAITLVYVFAPTFFIEGDAAGSVNNRKRGAVGLHNTANDCFINSVLQALAGLGDLRLYLIRETHRRSLDGAKLYKHLVEDPRRRLPAWKLEGLQQGIVTQGLKEMLDALNEKPLYKKSISALTFLRCLENAFRQRISRQQQDAQEFLQIVAERLCDEYHAGQRARKARGVIPSPGLAEAEPVDGATESHSSIVGDGQDATTTANSLGLPQDGETAPGQQSSQPSIPELVPVNEEEGFPFEGRYESQIECLTCRFKPRPTVSTFCTLTLNVPQVSSTTLNACFDGMFKTEYIEDFKCEKCRLLAAIEVFQHELKRSTSEKFKTELEKSIESLKEAVDKNPEEVPDHVVLPDPKFAPKRKIARHIRITKFPKIMAIHLSRSIFDVGRVSEKNSARVAFPERLPLGGLLEQRKYKLLSLVTHKGGHHSGHYESFRRQNIYPPFSTPNAFEKTGVYSKTATPEVSAAPTPQLEAVKKQDDTPSSSSSSELLPLSPQASSRVSLSSTLSAQGSRTKSHPGPTSAPREPTSKMDPETSSLRSVARSARTTLAKGLSRASNPKSSTTPSASSTSLENIASKERRSTATIVHKPAHKKKIPERWWRISDEKVSESKTADVLKMQREVYLLFYELDKDTRN
jgi:ubiquitin carboxyl-terminal hydrolase 16